MHRYMRGMSNGGAISGEALDNDRLYRACPSIFATEAHESRSARFAPIPTINVIEGLRNEGFDPFFAQQSRTRVPGKQNFTKHMIRLRHRTLTNSDEEAFEIILVNANDGTSSYQMLPGFFKFVCANGLMTGDTFNEVKVRHSGDAVGEVIEGAYTVLEEAPRVCDQVAQFKSITLDDHEKTALAEAALTLRYEDESPIDAPALLRARRYADNHNDLWNTFNRVQENLIRGGQRYVNNGRRNRVREVQGIDQSKKINRALWTLTEALAAHKTAA